MEAVHCSLVVDCVHVQVRVRPVFVISEAFCRAHKLPHKRILRPPTFTETPEVVNHTKLAIRYTSYMTKDMIFSALREIFTGVRDYDTVEGGSQERS